MAGPASWSEALPASPGSYPISFTGVSPNKILAHLIPFWHHLLEGRLELTQWVSCMGKSKKIVYNKQKSRGIWIYALERVCAWPWSQAQRGQYFKEKQEFGKELLDLKKVVGA